MPTTSISRSECILSFIASPRHKIGLRWSPICCEVISRHRDKHTLHSQNQVDPRVFACAFQYNTQANCSQCWLYQPSLHDQSNIQYCDGSMYCDGIVWCLSHSCTGQRRLHIRVIRVGIFNHNTHTFNLSLFCMPHFLARPTVLSFICLYVCFANSAQCVAYCFPSLSLSPAIVDNTHKAKICFPRLKHIFYAISWGSNAEGQVGTGDERPVIERPQKIAEHAKVDARSLAFWKSISAWPVLFFSCNEFCNLNMKNGATSVLLSSCSLGVCPLVPLTLEPSVVCIFMQSKCL